MWKPPINFLTLHYAYIIFSGLLGIVVIYPYGNVSAIDSYFFGVSASTESGLNPIDVKDLKTYQQLLIYFVATFTNVGFINIIVVVIRLYWFNKRLKEQARTLWRSTSRSSEPRDEITRDVEAQPTNVARQVSVESRPAEEPVQRPQIDAPSNSGKLPATEAPTDSLETADTNTNARITFAESVRQPGDSKALYIPTPRERDRGVPFVEKDVVTNEHDDGDAIKPVDSWPDAGGLTRRRTFRLDGPSLATARSIEQAAASVFILGSTQNQERPRPISRQRSADLPFLSKEVTIGRNSQFHNLTEDDRERLGGMEYRALKFLLRIVLGYYFGLQIFGIICLVPWIHNAPTKYTDWLRECAQGETWWAIFSSQSLVNNLGFTLTPDSMISFRDATWPMLLMTFLAFAGNTFYPVFLRLVIWTMSKLVPKESSTKETLQFLLDHPRRCYTLLFPSRPTWILFGTLFALNFIDVLLIIVLDLNNPSVNDLPIGPRLLSAIFQSASSRHTGTQTYNLSLVNPGVQFSLLVMMYVAVLPVAISIRTSNTYEERTLGIYEREEPAEETKGISYLTMHIRNQLSFDLWYIFLGTFCICVAEADRVMDTSQPAFAVFPIFFEVVSAYGNVGLSLGHPDVMTSLSGQFDTFSKVVICAMMIRGRHRGLPYALDRAIMLPGERLEDASEHTAVSQDGSTRDKNQMEALNAKER